jgi:hydrogenase/urease accessory protein HupE
MRLSKLFSIFSFLPAMLLASQVYAHPGHHHDPGFAQRVVHALLTEWHWSLAALAVVVGGVVYLRRRT